MDTLAINGGKKAVKDKLIKPWPPIGALDRKMVLASLNGGQHAFGPNCRAFEKEFAAWNGNTYAINTNSGTAALHMAVVACGLSAGDHVLVTAYSWSSSATCILHHNCIPVFVDIDFNTINIDVRKIEQAITPKTRAIIVVHLHGLAVDMDAVLKIARKHKLAVIEDACQAHGALFKNKKVGTFGDCAAFSFNQNKCLCTGEGGMFVTNNEQIYKKATQLWSFGETATPAQSRDYHAYALGWMYRSSDLVGAFGRAQLSRMDHYFKTQRANGALLMEELKGTPGLILPTEPAGHTHNWYNFTSRIDMNAVKWNGAPVLFRNAVMKALVAEGVPANVWQSFILPAMTVFRAKNAYGHGCPWDCRLTEPVEYDPAKFPVAQRHCDTHFGMTTPLRTPNGKATVKAVARGFQKVFSQLNQLDIEKILEVKKK
ncbi:MAG: DegT/DnrJ/EryC1/StrS family aminotransferase [Verrucomicrobia bacterium]|nr:DegT/DnrJ/EryC1/StrS family aminotransferase [Verrucomicrobiota bacterium]MBU1735623.1 DegT/DnrJ/EryC1/StrS family aminotransferase [Verrucomicrobiota bacterium]